MSGGNTESLSQFSRPTAFSTLPRLPTRGGNPVAPAGAEINLRGDATMRLAAPSYTADVWSF